MAYARVVTFDGVQRSGIDEVAGQIQNEDPPEGLPASEVIVLFDEDGGRSLAITFFETEDDYRQGDRALNEMSPPGSFGTRSGVGKYEVVVRRSTS
jgi:hypothetical protein